jgi:hypothetical protein
MQDVPVKCAAMMGPLRSSPIVAALLERSSRVVRHAMNASNRRSSASVSIRSVVLPDPRRARESFLEPWQNLRVGKFPVATSARPAIMEKRPNGYGYLQPEYGCASSNHNVNPAELLTTSCNYYVGAELRGWSRRRRLVIVVRILARRPDG